MSVQTELSVDVDLDIEIPCEDREHGRRVPGLDEPAQYIAWWKCGACGKSRKYNSCIPCWVAFSMAKAVIHSACGMSARPEVGIVGRL